MARLATMTCQERAHLFYIKDLILILHKSVLHIINTESHALKCVEQFKSGLRVCGSKQSHYAWPEQNRA